MKCAVIWFENPDNLVLLEKGNKNLEVDCDSDWHQQLSTARGLFEFKGRAVRLPNLQMQRLSVTVETTPRAGCRVTRFTFLTTPMRAVPASTDKSANASKIQNRRHICTLTFGSNSNRCRRAAAVIKYLTSQSRRVPRLARD